MNKRGEEEKAEEGEEEIRHILTDPKLSAIKALLEKDHAIDCLFLLHMNRGKWKPAKTFMDENDLTLSDGTFRSRMIEITELGMAEPVPIDPIKKYYVQTDFGKKVAELLLDFFHELED